MATTVNNASLQIVAKGQVSESAGAQSLDTTSLNPSINQTQSFTTGTGPNQASLLYAGSRNVNAASENLDLTSTLKDAFGTVIDFSTLTGANGGVKAIAIYNTNTTAGSILKVGGAGANGWIGGAAHLGPFNANTDQAVIGAGGLFAITSPIDGFVVTAAGQRLLKVDPGANNITYQIEMWG